MEVVSLVEPNVFRTFAGEPWPRHAPEYIALKDRLIARLVERIEAYAPGFRDLVAFAELATPLSFATFQHSADGAFYGLDATPDRILSPLTSAVTDVPGLFLAGQDVVSPGIGGAIMGGVLAASAALRPRDRVRMWSKLKLTHRGRLSVAPRAAGRPWRGYLKVTRIIAETPMVKTFRLENPDGGPLPFDFAPGQFLTLSLPAPGGMVRRHYSIASAAVEKRHCTITVKREPYGLGSRHLHDVVAVGRCLLVEGPLGRFTLPDGVSAPLAPAAVLIAGGAGITPLMSVLRQLYATGSHLPVTFLAYFRTPDEIIFRDELMAIAEDMPSLTLRTIVEHPDADWAAPVGRPTKALIATTAGSYLATARVHVCGPRLMMDAVTAILADLQVPPEHIRIEDFFAAAGGESVARDRAIRIVAAAGVPIAKFDISFRKLGRTVDAVPGQSVLDAALAKGVPIRHACGAGCCGECRLRIDRGTFETEDPNHILTQEERRDGYVLACRTYPTSDVELAA